MQHWDEELLHNVWSEDQAKFSHAEKHGQSVEVVLLGFEIEQLLDDILLSPLGTEDLCQLFEILDGSYSYGVDAIVEPFETYGDELVREELLIELSG